VHCNGENKLAAYNTVKRIRIFNVPIDILPEESFDDTIRDFLADGGQHQIVFLSFDGLLKARRNNDFARTVAQAHLVIPTSKRILKAARFLNLPVPVRYMPFTFVIKLLGVLEKYKKTLYLAGLKPPALQIVSGNLRASFPGLSIVGRCAGYFRKDSEEDITLAIKKAAPSLLLCGNGIPGKNTWLFRNRKNFNSGLFLWCGECFDIFAGKAERLSTEQWNGRMYWFFKSLKKPWRLWKILPYLQYLFLLVIEKIKR